MVDRPVNAVGRSSSLIHEAAYSRQVAFTRLSSQSYNSEIVMYNLIKGIDCKVNIIPYNETDGKYQRPTNEEIERFLETLNKKYPNGLLSNSAFKEFQGLEDVGSESHGGA